MIMISRLSQIILFPTIWAALVIASLQTKLLFTESTHSVCGPWGCGPPTGALVTAHADWLAMIGPPWFIFLGDFVGQCGQSAGFR